MKYLKHTLPFLSLLVLAGCNHPQEFGRTSQLMEVTTPGVAEVECDMQTIRNRYRVVTPEVQRIERTNHEMTITCEKTGYEKAVVKLAPQKDLWLGVTQWNGMAPALLDGNYYVFPEKVEVMMKRIIVPETMEKTMIRDTAQDMAGEMPAPLAAPVIPVEEDDEPSALFERMQSK